MKRRRSDGAESASGCRIKVHPDDHATFLDENPEESSSDDSESAGPPVESVVGSGRNEMSDLELCRAAQATRRSFGALSSASSGVITANVNVEAGGESRDKDQYGSINEAGSDIHGAVGVATAPAAPAPTPSLSQDALQRLRQLNTQRLLYDPRDVAFAQEQASVIGVTDTEAPSESTSVRSQAKCVGEGRQVHSDDEDPDLAAVL